MADDFAVLLTEGGGGRPKVAAVGKVISQFRRVPLQDAIHQVKFRWGLVEEHLSGAEAEALIGILKKEGFTSVRIPSSQIAALPKPGFVLGLQFGAKGLEVSPQKGDWRIVPWESIALLGAAAFKQKVAHMIKSQQGPSPAMQLLKTGLLLATGIPLPTAKKKTVTIKVEETEIYLHLDIVLRRPEVRIRVDASSLDYKFLQEKMGVGSQTNFRILIKELRARAPHAICNTGARSLIAEPAIPVEIYETEQELDRECRWLLTLAALKGEG